MRVHRRRIFSLGHPPDHVPRRLATVSGMLEMHSTVSVATLTVPAYRTPSPITAFSGIPSRMITRTIDETRFEPCAAPIALRFPAPSFATGGSTPGKVSAPTRRPSPAA